jgi:hypothetical protein
MNNFIRQYFKQNKILFYLWYKIYRSRQGTTINWFNKSTNFYFDGYPRSGNTFMLHLLRGVYQNQSIVHHFHAIAPLKIALSKNIKSIIIFREPSESISSNYLKQYEGKSFPDNLQIDVLEKLLFDYLAYYENIIEYKDKVHLICFDDLISKPEITMEKVDTFLGYSSKLRVKNIVSERKSVKFGSKSTIGSSLPNAQKEELKFIVKKSLLALNRYDEATEIYERLSKINR